MTLTDIATALAGTAGVFLLLSIFFFLTSDAASSWDRADRLALFGWVAMGIGTSSALAAMWLAAAA